MGGKQVVQRRCRAATKPRGCGQETPENIVSHCLLPIENMKVPKQKKLSLAN